MNDDNIGPLENFDCIYKDCGKFIVPSEINYDFTRITGEAFILKSEEQLNAALFFNEFTEKIAYLIRDSSQRAGISTANGNLAFCQRNLLHKTSLNCTRGDFRRWTELSFDYEPQNSIIYSAPRGKYLVLTSEKLKSRDNDDEVSFAFYLTAFNSRGFRQNSMRVTALDYYGDQTILHAQIYESNDDEFCVTLLDEGELTIHAKCFSKEYLFFRYD
ncbi:hypothetical protein QAD02_011236 [Eretmocerus hayati]|uniref:Uncharacterized protein n=1 Tax=Eretmocerus hayati TaxID=131215 RepID=A0ACC2P0X5_9HYME|nr:hypothetical protein QAD02_011236 [Eretmocerus hayati]